MNRQFIFFLSLVSIFITASTARAQRKGDASLDIQMTENLLESNYSTPLMKAMYHRLVDSPDFPAHCDSARLAAHLWLHIQQLMPWDDEPFPLDTADCPVTNHALHYALGLEAFRQQKWDEMHLMMRKAREQATTDRGEMISWQGVGLAYQMKGQMDSAYFAFVQSVEAAPGELDAIGMNNLSNSANIGEQWSAARDWAIRAEETYYASLRNGVKAEVYGPNFHDNILSNRIIGEMQLNMAQEAQLTFDRMNFGPCEDANCIMMAATAAAFLLWREDREAFSRLKPVLEEWLAVDSALAVEVMGGHVLIFSPWAETWQRLTGMTSDQTWSYVQSLPPLLRDVALPRGGSPQAPREVETLPSWMRPVALGFTCLALILGIRRSRRRRFWQTAEDAALLATIEQELEKNASMFGRQTLRVLVRRIAKKKEFDDASVTELTRREQEIYDDWSAGIRPKETAMGRGITTATVYNIRTSIRKKLGIPKGIELPEWLNSQSQDSHLS